MKKSTYKKNLDKFKKFIESEQNTDKKEDTKDENQRRIETLKDKI